MASGLTDLAFSEIFVRLDADEPAQYRARDKAQNLLSQFIPEAYVGAVAALTATLRGQGADAPQDQILMVEPGLRCRIVRQAMADGALWAYIKRISSDVPDLSKLGFAPHIFNHLHQLGTREGLIVISGGAGQGKTTTAAALIVDFMKTYGGLAFTVEAPIEYPLKGRHGDYGQCFQLQAKDDDNWEACLKQALSWNPRYLFVGDVRTPKAAELVMRAASTGRTVITTVLAASPEETLTYLLSLGEQAVGSNAQPMLAGCMTAVAHQTMKDFGPFLKYLFTEENAPSDPIRSLIREGKMGMLSTYIDRISARLGGQQATPAAGGPMFPPVTGLPPLKK